VPAQAGSRPQGLFDAHPGAWRRARPAGFAVLRAAGERNDVPVLRRHMIAGVAVLGSTGSIGRSALEVLRRQRERFRVVALTAHSNGELLAQQKEEWRPSFVGMVNGGGAECLVAAATHPDARIVINGIVGAAGLEATLAALRAGKRVALANKETLVMAGELVTAAARAGGGEIVPVDSEHSAVLQCLAGRSTAGVSRLLLTPSGGPFRPWGPARHPPGSAAAPLRHPPRRIWPQH